MAIDVGFEVTKELADQTCQLVEKSKTGGKIRKGVNEVTKSLERGEAKLVVVAGDVNPSDILLHIPVLCKEKNVPLIQVPAKEELGASAGLPVGTAVVGIVDAGSGKTLLSTISKSIASLTGKPVKAEAGEE